MVHTFSEESSRVVRTLQLIQKEKLTEELQLFEKQRKQYTFLRRKLATLRSGMQHQLQSLKNSVDHVRQQLAVERSHEKHLRNMSKKIHVLDNSVNAVHHKRTELLSREQRLLTNLGNFMTKNKEVLHYHSKSNIFDVIVANKKSLLQHSSSMNEKEQSSVFADVKELQSLCSKQRITIHKIQIVLKQRSASLKRLSAEYKNVLKKEQSLNKKINTLKAACLRIHAQLRKVSL
ncbi:MAG TPA: hypothetical protein VJK72_05640 [Candidatus Nanoarchaeia archaeon]|nr:hypothetical protein [Candidatus Nanoarchaeia archaeon]